MLTEQFTNKPTHSQSSCSLVNLWTSQMPTAIFKNHGMTTLDLNTTPKPNPIEY